MAAYLSYTADAKLFPGWPVMVLDMHTTRRRSDYNYDYHTTTTFTSTTTATTKSAM